MTMSIKYLITLTEEEQTLLQQIIKKNKSTALRTKRAFVLLACADISQTNHQISAAYHMSVRAIERLRKRFVEEGFALALEGKNGVGTSKKLLTAARRRTCWRCGAAPRRAAIRSGVFAC